jgi:hypothetical protein
MLKFIFVVCNINIVVGIIYLIKFLFFDLFMIRFYNYANYEMFVYKIYHAQ